MEQMSWWTGVVKYTGHGAALPKVEIIEDAKATQRCGCDGWTRTDWRSNPSPKLGEF